MPLGLSAMVPQGRKEKNLTRMLPSLYPSLVFFHLLLWLLDRLKQREEAGGVSQCREGDPLKQGEEQRKDGWCMEMVISKEENEAESWGVGIKQEGQNPFPEGSAIPLPRKPDLLLVRWVGLATSSGVS